MDSFEEKKLIEIHRMSLDELNRYYRYLRKYEFEKAATIRDFIEELKNMK